MTPMPSSSKKVVKPILKRTPSGVTKTVTFSATNSQVFFADDWDRSAVEVVSKLSYSDVLELKQLSLDSLPADRHASMGLSPLLSRVPLALCPLADESKKSAPDESRAAQPSPSPASSPLVIPDLSILASPVSTASALESSLPPPPLSPVSSDAESSVSVSLGSASPHTSASSPESTPPKTNAKLTAPVPIRRTLMMNFQPLLPEPGSELPSPVLSASSSLSDSSTDSGKTLSLLVPPQTPTTPRTPHSSGSLSPIPASPTTPTSLGGSSPQTQGPPPGAAKSRASRAEKAHYSALSGPPSGEVGAPSPTRSAGGTPSPVSPVSPASDTTVSVASGPLVRPVPRRAFAPQAPERALVRRASVSSATGNEPVTRTKASRGFDGTRSKRLAIDSKAWVDGALPDELESGPVARLPIEVNLRSVPLPSSSPTPAPPRPRRSHSMNEAPPSILKYANPYSQIRETEEPQPEPELTRLQARRSSSDRDVQRSRIAPSPIAKASPSLPAVPHLSEGGLGLSLKTSRPPPSGMNRPTPTHRASMHGYPFGANRPPSPTPQSLSRVYPSPLSPNTPLPQQQPQARSGRPLAAKDANVRGSGPGTGYTLAVDGGLGVNSADRKLRTANDLLPPSPILAPYCAPMARPKNSKVGR